MHVLPIPRLSLLSSAKDLVQIMPGRDPLVLCFVDFVSPAHAATALDALQGYPFDEDDRDSVNLRMQFARHPGARTGGGHRGKR